VGYFIEVELRLIKTQLEIGMWRKFLTPFWPWVESTLHSYTVIKKKFNPILRNLKRLNRAIKVDESEDVYVRSENALIDSLVLALKTSDFAAVDEALPWAFNNEADYILRGPMARALLETVGLSLVLMPVAAVMDSDQVQCFSGLSFLSFSQPIEIPYFRQIIALENKGPSFFPFDGLFRTSQLHFLDDSKQVFELYNELSVHTKALFKDRKNPDKFFNKIQTSFQNRCTARDDFLPPIKAPRGITHIFNYVWPVCIIPNIVEGTEMDRVAQRLENFIEGGPDLGIEETDEADYALLISEANRALDKALKGKVDSVIASPFEHTFGAIRPLVDTANLLKDEFADILDLPPEANGLN